MKINFKACIVNGIKGAFLLLLLAAISRFVYAYLSSTDWGIALIIALLPCVAILFLYIVFQIIPKMKGYTDDPDWDIEAGLSKVIALFIFLITLLTIYS